MCPPQCHVASRLVAKQKDPKLFLSGFREGKVRLSDINVIVLEYVEGGIVDI